MILDAGLSVSELVNTAWAAAASFRGTDLRGGANGGRIRLAPQKDWKCNNPQLLAKALPILEEVQTRFNAEASGNKKISFADTVVLGGCAAVEKAARDAGYDITVPFTPGRTDATDEMTDADAMTVLETTADGFINYLADDHTWPAEHLLVEKARLLTLTAPEMTVLVGGMRALNANYAGSELGVFTTRPGTLTNDFFVNLLDMKVKWEAVPDAGGSVHTKQTEKHYVGKDRKTGEEVWKGSAVDLIFGHNGQLRAISEVYGGSDAGEKFVNDFVKAWDKVMNLDRFDLD